MKILFSLRHPLGFRNFEPVVRELARRGHTVRLSFLTSDKRLAPSHPTSFNGEVVGVSWSTLPSRKGEPWLEQSRSLRVLNDALRYRLPMYDQAEKLRERATRRLSSDQARVARLRFWRWPFANKVGSAVLNHLDACLPPSDVILSDVLAELPDLILVSPLVDFGSEQVDYIKVGRLLGIPSVLAVNSWDNLTNKGRIRLQPDHIFVWNEIQRDEAVHYHGSRREDVTVTGAPVYDRWFDRGPGQPAADFKRRVGLDPSRSYLLYLCSSPFVAEHEALFVERWLTWIRAASDPSLRDIEVLIRPHPENRQPWGRLEAMGLTGVRVWPATGESPTRDQAANDYFNSICHSRAVVGINSSGLIEAGIIGRPVLTMLDPEFTATQEGTIHFHHLMKVGGGLLRAARSWPEHAAQLREALAQSAEDAREASVRFVQEFIRPHGLGVAATPRLVENLTALAEKTVKPRPGPKLGARAVRRLLGQRAGRRPPPPALDPSRRPARGGQGAAPVARQIEELAASDADGIVLGPWHGDLSAEVVYWLPFLSWVTRRLGRERLVAVSRGGVDPWYEAHAANYLDILDYFTLAEMREGTDSTKEPGDVPRRSAHFDREVVRVVKQAFGMQNVRTLHPSVLAELGRQYWKGGPADAIVKFAVPRPLPAPCQRTRGGYVFVGLPGNDTAPSLDQEQLIAALDTLTSRATVVISGASTDLLARVRSTVHVRAWTHVGPDASRTASLVEALSSAAAFVGLHSSYDLLPAQCGVPTLLIRRSVASDQRHIEHARRMATERGGATIDQLSSDDPDLLRALLRLADGAT